MKLFNFQKQVETAEEPQKGASREYPELKETEQTANVIEQDWWWQPFWTFSALFIFAGVLWSVGVQMWQWLDRPVDKVVIFGTAQHLDRKQLALDIADDLEQSLLQVNIESVQDLVKEQPWVRVAAIKRDWPSTLIVNIEEEVPVARWGERGLLNHQGDIFWPELKEEYRALPRLSGPAPDTGRVMSQFHDLNQMFRPVGLSVVSLDLEARGAWTLELDNQIRVVVGRESVNERLQRFLDLYQLRLAEKAADIEQIDIRYTHGVAVKWRPKPDEENAG